MPAAVAEKAEQRAIGTQTNPVAGVEDGGAGNRGVVD